MRVPVTPQTNVPTGELGYERAVDVTQGGRMLAAVVDKYAQEAEKEQKKRELFDVEKLLVDETNSLQGDFEDRTKKAPLGAYGFTQQTNTDYNARHQEIIKAVKERGYSADAIHELETRLGVIRGQYVAKAIDFQEKSNFAKTVVDADHMSISLSQYAEKNPNGLESALSSLRTGLEHSGLSAPEIEQVYEAKKGTIIKAAQTGFALQHPEIVTALYGMENEQDGTPSSSSSSATGFSDEPFNISTYVSKLAPAEGTGKNPNSSAVGFGQFIDSTWLGTYKEVYGNTGETKAQILAKKKDRAVAQKLTEKLTSNNIRGLRAANAPVNYETVYLAHFLGLNDAVKVISAHADDTIKSLVTPASIKANQSVFKKVQTAGDMIAFAQKKMNVSGATVTNDFSPEDIASLHEVYDKVTAETAPAIFENGKKLSFDQFVSKASNLKTPEPQEVLKASGIEFDEAGKTGIPVIDMASGPERIQMLTVARQIMNERDADAKAAEREAHTQKLNDFYNGVEDGRLGQSDIDQAYKNGLFSDYDERNKAQSIYDSKHKEDTALVTFNTMYRSGQKFNPYDNNAQKAVDAGFAHTVKYVSEHPDTESATPFTIAMQIWNKTGIIPTQGAVMLRGALVSTDPNQVGQAAAVANNMIRTNPNAFAGVEGQAEIEHSAVAYGRYIYDLGMSPQEAAQRVASENDPQVKAKYKYNDPANSERIKDLNKNGVNAGQVFKDAKFGSQDQLNEANQTYYELIRSQLDRGQQIPEAIAQANAQMQKVYGVNFEGVVVKYPPERAYPAINGTWNYVYLDAKDTVKAETGREPKHLRLTPIPGVTDEDFRRGRPARYRIIYSYEANGHEVVDSVPGEFAADVGAAQRVASIQHQQEFAKARGTYVTEQQKRKTQKQNYGITYIGDTPR